MNLMRAKADARAQRAAAAGNARRRRRRRGGSGQCAAAKADARLSEAGAAVGRRARARRGQRDRLYIGALWRNNNKGEERARRMNTSTRLRFTIAVCALGVAAADRANFKGYLR